MEEFHEFLEKYRNLSLWWLFQMFGVPFDAAGDVASEGWATVWRRWNTRHNRDERSTKKWVFLIFRSKAVDYHRKVERQVETGLPGGTLESIPSSSDREPPLTDAISAEVMALLDEAVAELNAKDAESLRTWIALDRDTKACAKAWDLSERGARKRVSSIRGKLRKKLDQKGVEIPRPRRRPCRKPKRSD